MAKRNQRKKEFMTKEYYMKLWTLRLSDLACNMFIYNGFPKEINMESVPKQIMLGGFAIFFRDKELDKYFCLPGALTGVSAYGYPTRAKPIAKGTGITFPELIVDEECVIIYCNKARSTALPYINEYADKLTDLDLALKMNTGAMKHPLMIKTTEQKKESISSLIHQYEDDYFVVFPDNDLLNQTSLEVMDFKVSASELAHLQKQKETVLNEFFNLFGVSGSVEKRERMISGEMNAMMEQTAVNRQIWLGSQSSAIDKINRLYGLNLSIDVPKYMKEEEMEEQPENGSGGKPDVSDE